MVFLTYNLQRHDKHLILCRTLINFPIILYLLEQETNALFEYVVLATSYSTSN